MPLFRDGIVCRLNPRQSKVVDSTQIYIKVRKIYADEFIYLLLLSLLLLSFICNLTYTSIMIMQKMVLLL